MGNYYAGLDLGQSHDYTALAVLERAELWGAYDPMAIAHRKDIVLRVKHLERVPLGTSYPDVVARVESAMRNLAGVASVKGESCELFVDAAGVGRPVVDLLRAAELRCRMTPAVITGGHTESYSAGHLHIPKKDLIACLQLALQQKALQISDSLEFAGALLSELTEMRVRITPSGGHEQFGVWREGAHDDLVFAVALACLGARKRNPADTSGTPQYWSGLTRIVGS